MVALSGILFYFAQPPLVVSKYSFANAFLCSSIPCQFVRQALHLWTQTRKYGIPLSRYTVFLKNCPLGYDPKSNRFFIYILFAKLVVYRSYSVLVIVLLNTENNVELTRTLIEHTDIDAGG